MSRKDPTMYDHPVMRPSLCGSLTGIALYDTPLSWAMYSKGGFLAIGDERNSPLTSTKLQALIDGIDILTSERSREPREFRVDGKPGDRWGIAVKRDEQGRVYVTVDSVAYALDQPAMRILTETRCPCCKRSIKRVRLMRIFEAEGPVDDGE